MADVNQWQTSATHAGDLLRSVNTFVNDTIAYAPEPYGSDHWQTPGETLDRGAGDCEDFAILKMAELYASGVDPGEMAVVVGDLHGGVSHAILVVKSGGGELILDNRARSPYRPELIGFTPHYCVNQNGRFILARKLNGAANH